jgi:hypothetical protein
MSRGCRGFRAPSENPNGMDSFAPAHSALRAFGFAKFLSPFPERLKSVPKPRVARNELPWVIVRKQFPTATRLRPFRLPACPN